MSSAHNHVMAAREFSFFHCVFVCVSVCECVCVGMWVCGCMGVWVCGCVDV